MSVTVPSEFSVNAANALVPASATTRCPPASKLTANGTVPGSELTTGESDSRPLGCTANTSIALVAALVVTISWVPSGEKATCPGVCVNWLVSVGIVSPSERRDPSIGWSFQPAAESTGVVGVGEGEGAVVSAVVSNDLVAGGVVGLDEHDMVGPLGADAVGWMGKGGGGERADERSGERGGRGETDERFHG